MDSGIGDQSGHLGFLLSQPEALADAPEADVGARKTASLEPGPERPRKRRHGLTRALRYCAHAPSPLSHTGDCAHPIAAPHLVFGPSPSRAPQSLSHGRLAEKQTLEVLTPGKQQLKRGFKRIFLAAKTLR